MQAAGVLQTGTSTEVSRFKPGNEVSVLYGNVGSTKYSVPSQTTFNVPMLFLE